MDACFISDQACRAPAGALGLNPRINPASVFVLRTLTSALWQPSAIFSRPTLQWRAAIYCALAAWPIGFLALQVATWVRDIPNWDEFDTALDFLITLDSGAGLREIMERLLAVNNEHRMVVSRLIFATAYWVSGGINFTALAVLGNLFLVAAFVVLLMHEAETAPRLRLMAIFALTVFQLQHHESLFWAGSSIDHFFVILAAIAALGALTRPNGRSLAFACSAALLATFSLAHGMIVWPVGTLLLFAERRWRHTMLWATAGVGSLALYFTGFEFNPAHRLPNLAEFPRVLEYWLALAGCSPALDDVTVAPWFGGLLVVTTVLVAWRGYEGRERLAFAAIGWCLGAMAMIAWGRALLSNEWAPISSRYVILSSIAWGLLIWIVVERRVRRYNHTWWLVPVFAALAAFNLAANDVHLAAGRLFARNGEKAVLAFHLHGTFAGAETPLYPDPDWADELIRRANARGIFELPESAELRICEAEEVPLSDPVEIADATYFIEEVTQTSHEVRVLGWALRPDRTARPGDIAVVFRSPAGLRAFDATPRARPDVAAALERWDATYAGFELRVPVELLPEGEHQIGICFDPYDDPEYMMTAHAVGDRKKRYTLAP